MSARTESATERERSPPHRPAVSLDRSTSKQLHPQVMHDVPSSVHSPWHACIHAYVQLAAGKARRDDGRPEHTSGRVAGCLGQPIPDPRLPSGRVGPRPLDNYVGSGFFGVESGFLALGRVLSQNLRPVSDPPIVAGQNSRPEPTRRVNGVGFFPDRLGRVGRIGWPMLRSRRRAAQRRIGIYGWAGARGMLLLYQCQYVSTHRQGRQSSDPAGVVRRHVKRMQSELLTPVKHISAK